MPYCFYAAPPGNITGSLASLVGLVGDMAAAELPNTVLAIDEFFKF